MSEIYLSVIIPAYNEEKVIANTLKSVNDFLVKQSYGYEILVADDGSTDNTKKIVKDLSKKYKNLKLLEFHDKGGKGGTVKAGIIASCGKFKLFMDSDNATPFEQIKKLLSQTNDHDIVLSSRYVKGAKIEPKRSFFRTLVSRGGNIVINFILRLPFKDTRCGFKLFSAHAANITFSRIKQNGFSFDDELLVIARKFGLRICEVPVIWHDMEALTGSKSKVSLKDVLYSFVEMFQTKINLWKGEYK